MKKRFVTVITLLVASAFTCAVFGCSKKDKIDANEPETSTVTFDANGGTFDGGAATYVETVENGSCAVGKTPTRSGYDFTFWYRAYDPDTAVVLSSTPITADITLYAGWLSDDPVSYSVTVAATENGTVTADRATAAEGETVTLTVTPANGYRLSTLKYNDVNIDTSAAVYAFAMPKGDVTVTATFELTDDPDPQPTLERISVVPPTKTEYIAGQALNLAGLVVTAHYSDNSSETVTAGYTTSPASGAALTVVNTSVTVEYGGKTTSFDITVVSRAVSALEISGTLENPTQYVGSYLDVSGLTFTATYNDGTSGRVDVSDITFTSSALTSDNKLQAEGDRVSITASYGGKDAVFALAVETPAVPLHDILFDANNAEFASFIVGLPAKRTVEEGEGTHKPDAPTLVGFDFGGWFKESNCINEWDFENDTIDTADVILYAKWTAKEYDVTYTLDGGANAASNPTKYKATDGDVILAQPTRDHYDFDGWYTVAGVKVEKIDYTRIVHMTAADIKLQARWIAKKYGITYILGGTDSTYEATLSPTAPDKYTYGATTALPGSSYVTVVNKDGDSVPYTFIGWYLSGDPTETIVDNITPQTSGDKTFVAKIEKMTTFAFTFDYGYDYNGDGKTTSTRNIVENEKAVNRDLSGARKGYVFGGWFEDNGTFGTAYDFDTPVTAVKTIYAKWTPINYTIEYIGDGFTTTLPTTYKITDADTALAAPALEEGYYFDGWFLDVECEGNAVATLNASLIDDADGENTITLYAKSGNVYNVVYNANKPAGVENTTSGMPVNGTVIYGEKIAEPTTVPDLPNYGFLGWYTDAACENEWDFDTAVNGAVGISAENRTFVLYVKWYEKPTDGKYILGSFNGWNSALENAGASSYKASVTRYDTADGKNVAKEWAISGLTLKAGDEFKFADYTKTAGIDWSQSSPYTVSYTVRPSVMAVVCTDGGDPNYKIDAYAFGDGHTWTVEFGENASGDKYITFTLDGYIAMRDPTGGNNVPSKAETLEDGVWYFAGNFTDWFGQSEAWSTNAAVRDGDKFHFTRVYLKKYDTFKVMSSAGEYGTWLGGTFGTLGAEFVLSSSGDNICLDTIEDGYYNIVFDPVSGRMTVYEYADVRIALDPDNTVYVGDRVTKEHFSVTADGVSTTDFELIGSTDAVGGDNANTVKIICCGGVFEFSFTATAFTASGVTVTGTLGKTEYLVGDAFDPTGLVFTLVYDNGRTKLLSASDMTFGVDRFTVAGNDIAITAIYGDFTASGDIKVNVANRLTSIVVDMSGVVPPHSAGFVAGDRFDGTGIAVTARYNEGIVGATVVSEPVTDYTLDPADKTLVVGDNVFTVAYLGKTAEFTVTAIARAMTDFTVSGSAAQQYLNGTFNTSGLIFTAHYNDGTTESVNADDISFTSTAFTNINTFGTFGDAVVTATFGGLSCDINVNIENTARYTVTFIANIAEYAPVGMPIAQSVQFGHTVTEPTAPTLKGFVFGGWYKNADCTSAWAFDTDVVNGNIGIYAKWTAIAYNIDYFVDGERSDTDTYAAAAGVFGDKQLKTPDDRADYRFVGWSLEENGADTFTVMTYDMLPDGGDTIRLYAVYVAIVYRTVAFDLNYIGAPTATTVRVEDGMTAERPADPTRSGYTFGGWYEEAACLTEYMFGDVVTRDITLYAKWTENVVEVTFDYNYEGAPAAKVVYVSENTAAVRPSPDPERDGYAFLGWFADESGKTEWKFDTVVTAPVTIYAKWQELTGNYITVDGDDTEYEMTDNSGHSEYHEVEYMYSGLKLKANDTVKFVVDDRIISAVIDAAVVGIDKSNSAAPQSSIKITADGTFTFYLYKTKATDTNWTIYGTYAEAPVLVEGAYYVVGSLNNWGIVSGYNLVDGSVTLELDVDDEFKIAKNVGGEVVWTGALGFSSVSSGIGYVKTSTDNNIVIKLKGTYTLAVTADNKISISSSDVEEPTDVDLSAYKTLEVVFNDKTVTFAFDLPSWATSDASLYIFGDTVLSPSWPGAAMDGSTITVDGNIAEAKLIVSFKENSSSKQSEDILGSSFADGSIYLVSVSDWVYGKDGVFNANIAKLA